MLFAAPGAPVDTVVAALTAILVVVFTINAIPAFIAVHAVTTVRAPFTTAARRLIPVIDITVVTPFTGPAIAAAFTATAFTAE